MSEINQPYMDEIELIDILRVLWKRKVLILTGVFVFGLAAVVLSLQLPKIYKAEMTIQPGILKINNAGERVYVNSLNNIAGRIKAGIYDNDIIEGVLKKTKDEMPEKLEFELEIPPDSNVLKIAYQAPDLVEGSGVLTFLFDLISKEEDELLKEIVEGYNYKINLNRLGIEKSKRLIKSYEQNEILIAKRIKEINNDIEVMNKNSVFLSYERRKLLDRKADPEGSLSVLLYSNTIQQSIQFVNTIKKDLNEHRSLKEIETQKIITEKDNQKKMVEKNHTLEKERDGIKKMKILIHPDKSSVLPVKPNKKMIVLLTLTAGLFFWIFCAFFIEYLSNNKLEGNNIR